LAGDVEQEITVGLVEGQREREIYALTNLVLPKNLRFKGIDQIGSAAACLCRCPAVDQVTQAAAFFTLCRQSFGGLISSSSWNTSVASLTAGQAQATAGWTNTINRLPEILQRLRRVQIDNADFRKVIKHYDRPETLFYMDPPYVMSTRKAGKYECELTDNDHRDLLHLIKHVRGMVLLSGYTSALYERELARWRCDRYKVKISACGHTQAIDNSGVGGMKNKNFDRVEVVWFNPKMARRLKKAGI